MEKLLTKNYRVVVFPNACREKTESTHNNDLPIVNSIRTKITATSNVYFVDQPVNTAAIRKMLNSCDGLLTSRFHAMIAGLTLGVPTLVLGWSHKYQEVLSLFGTEGYFLNWEQLAPDTIIEATESLLAERENVTLSLSSHLSQVKQSSARQFDWLQEYLNPETLEADA